MTAGMDDPLDPLAVRVLGSLVEKEFTTPDNYPLTLNALTAACNQTSNRDPVMNVDERAVSQSLAVLDRRSLVREVHRSDTRARRYRHLLTDTLNLHAEESAVLCVLMLRGAQTAGEIRTRTARMFEFRDVPHVEVTLQSLMTLNTPLVAQLPRRPGQKEVRYAHLLSGEPQAEEDAGDAMGERPVREPRTADRLTTLEQEVSSMRDELLEVRRLLDELRGTG